MATLEARAYVPPIRDQRRRVGDVRVSRLDDVSGAEQGRARFTIRFSWCLIRGVVPSIARRTGHG